MILIKVVIMNIIPVLVVFLQNWTGFLDIPGIQEGLRFPGFSGFKNRGRVVRSPSAVGVVTFHNEQDNFVRISTMGILTQS